MNYPRYFHRNKVKFRFNLHRQIISATLILFIIFSLYTTINPQINLNILKKNTFSNALKSFPQVKHYTNQRTAVAQTKPNEPIPELKLQFVYIDENCNKEFTEIYKGIIIEIHTKFLHQGSCSVSPTNLLPSYFYKESVIHNNFSIINSDSMYYLKPLQQYRNQSETKKHFLHEKQILDHIHNDKNIQENYSFSIHFDVACHYKINRNHMQSTGRQSTYTIFHMSKYNGPNKCHNITKLKEYYHNHQKLKTSKHTTYRIFQPVGNKNMISDQIISILDELYDIINVIVKCVGVLFDDRGSVITKTRAHNYTYGSNTAHSTLHQIKLNSAKSPGNKIQPSNLVMIISTIMMISLASSSAASPGAPISDHNINKFKVYHTLNTIGQSTLLTVYKYFKRFSDAKSIKDHLIDDFHLPEHEFRNNFDGTMIRVIEDTAASGEAYDISLLLKILRVLSKFYEPHNQRNWNDKHKLEFKCQKLADKRNHVFHSFTGLNSVELKNEIDEIDVLIKDILFSLEKRFPGRSSEIANIKIVVDKNISDILAQPLGEIEIKYYLFLKHFQFLKDEIPSYKISCKKWGKIKMLDFLSESTVFHDINILFTEVAIEKSERFNKNTPVKYTDIFNLASESSILLLDSETGGGKTTAIQYGFNDWVEGGKKMKTAYYNFIFPMIFRKQHLCSVGDLVMELIPKVGTNMSHEDVINCIADPSLNILFLCDGYDERNDNSNKLFCEILNLKEIYRHIKVIVTSRPDSVMELYHKKGSKLNIDHLKVIGIQESKRGDFLKKYHDELILNGTSHQSTEELLDFYESFSAHHKDLYRLPINLVILSWLWGQDPQLVKTIKSAAGLYAAILDILNQKLVNRMVISHPDVMSKIKNDIYELKLLIDSFKKKLFNESLVALSSDRIFINNTGVKNLRDVCRERGLPFSELQGAYLLASVDWNIKLVESLQIPHKGFLDFYAAKCIESKIIHEGKRVKDILLELYGNDKRKYKNDCSKYQNVLQLLGGILALEDSSLVEEHGKDIIILLIETGIKNNKQWFSVFSDFNINPTAAEKFAKLIAPHIDREHFIIKDADIDVVLTLLKYIDINKVTIEISSTVIPTQLPDLINVLRSKNCNIKISNIKDEQITLWNSIITPNDKIEISKVTLNHKFINNLPLHLYQNIINEFRLQQYWRQLDETAPHMTEYVVNKLWTAVSCITMLPTSVEELNLGILEEPGSRAAHDPGISLLPQYCQQLKALGVNVKVGTVMTKFPRLPELPTRARLHLSHLSDDSHLQWAVETASHLQPGHFITSRRGYDFLALPSCHLDVRQLCELVRRLAAAKVTIWKDGHLWVQSHHSDKDRLTLRDATRRYLKCSLYWDGE